MIEVDQALGIAQAEGAPERGTEPVALGSDPVPEPPPSAGGGAGDGSPVGGGDPGAGAPVGGGGLAGVGSPVGGAVASPVVPEVGVSLPGAGDVVVCVPSAAGSPGNPLGVLELELDPLLMTVAIDSL